MKKTIIASCQPQYIYEDIESSIKKIIESSKEAESANAAIICFPECFLQGYIVNENSKNIAIDIKSEKFDGILTELKNIKTVIVFGMIEKEGYNIYNTAIVIKNGRVLGKYRKVNLIGTEKQYFQAGNTFSIFEQKSLKFGINICYDTNFSESFKQIKKQGGELVLCLSNNMMSYEKSKKWKHEHNKVRSEKCIENNLWLISSDVTGELNGKISYGPTAIISNNGDIISQLPLEKPGLLIKEVCI